MVFNKDLSGFETLTGLKIDISDYAKGIYYVQIVTDYRVFTRKIVYQ
ncbi:MAG: T9SS type A sorting domain-containing protein [Bacteroidota bacterium]